MKKCLLITVVLLFILLNSDAQTPYYFRHYQVENGLSHNTVMCSLQDEKGFIWLGTKDGLNRFDGTSFKVFRHDEEDSTTIGNDYIRYLISDNNGGLLVGTQRGLYNYHPLTESFTHIASSGNKTIKEAIIDGEGNLWYIAEGTLMKLNKIDGRIKVYSTDKYFTATSLCIAADKSFWIATADGQLKKYNLQSDTFTTYNVFQKGAPANQWIEKIYASAKGQIFIGTAANGLLSFDPATALFKTIIRDNKDQTGIFVRDILQYNNDEYWLATESGLFVYNEVTGAIINLKKNYHDPYSLSDNAIYTLCKDKEGGLWAGTFFGGVNYFAPQRSLFRKFFPDYSKRTISGNAVREIVKDQYHNLWIGTEDAGLNKIDSTGAITHYMPNGTRGHLAYYNIHGLLAVNDKLWVGTFEHGLDILDIPSGKIVRHYDAGNKPGDLKSNFIFSICQTKTGQILIGTTAGVFSYRPSTDDFASVQQLNGYTYNILEDNNGVWWTATISEGIKFYDAKQNRSGSYQYDPANKNSISNNMVNSLFEDSQNNLWVATEGGGACCLLADRKTIKRYSTKNGLPSNFVFKILEDDHRQIWITTSQGLVQLNPQSGATTVFTVANGLLNDQFNYNSGYKSASGQLYFGSVKGMISFDPARLLKNSFIPPVYFTGFQVNGSELSITPKSALQQSILYTSSIRLPYNQSSFSIDFAALSFTAPQMNAYAYRMEGVDNKWMYLEKNRKVYFTDLAPGTYHFNVKAANSSGVWNNEEATLTITIMPPWWRSSLAYLLYGLAVAALLSLLVRNYHRRMKNKNQLKMDALHFEKEKEIYEAKMKFFTNIAHEIRTPLTLIKGPLQRVIKKTEDVPEIKTSLAIMERNTNRLLDLISQLLDYRQTEAGGFTLSFTKENISNLVEETFAGFKPLAEQKNLQYTLQLPMLALLAYTDTEAFNKIINNLLSNAIKYAGKEVAVKLVVNQVDQTFSIEIKNDGYLIPADMREKIFEPFVRLKKTEKQKGTGIGLALARSLTELHRGQLYMKDDEQRNVFVVTLPITQEKTAVPKTIIFKPNPIQKTAP